MLRLFIEKRSDGRRSQRVIVSTIAVMMIAMVILGSVMMYGSSINSIAAPSGDEGISSLIAQFGSSTKCRNVSAVVFDNGEISYYGDKEGLYQIGSMTKAFTGLAVHKLIVEGKLSEDDVVSKFIPGFEAYYDTELVDITIQNLLDQKSGYTNSESDYPSATAEMTLDEWAKSISGKELKSLPGTEYAYSNTNYNLLGLIIEKVSGMSYRDYLESEILTPLGLTDTYVGVPEAGTLEVNASEVSKYGESVKEAGMRIIEGTRLGYRHAFNYHIPVREASIPAGYFYSNATDMARWITIWTGNADVPADFAEPIKNVKDLLQTVGDYHSGWELFENDVIGHSGGTPNYSSRIVFSADGSAGVCVLTNLNVAASTDSLCNGIYDIIVRNEKGIITGDIWTVFDIIFTVVTIVCIVLLLISVIIKKKTALIITDGTLILLLTLILILFPIIFGAGMKEIAGTWAPLSLTGGLILMVVDIAVISIKLLSGIKHARSIKTGGGAAPHGHS